MKVLFMCVANSARSQLAEGLARQILSDAVHIESAGSNPSKVNPYAVQALHEIGADTTRLYSKRVEDLPSAFVQNLDFVITLCAEEVCPVILSNARKLHWPLPDPAGQPGTDAEQLERFRTTLSSIRTRLMEFGAEYAVLKG
jgi:arsenate reductase